jgi:DNA-binding transcriptional ArsR family regulator
VAGFGSQKRDDPAVAQAKVYAALADPVRLRFVREVLAAGEATGTLLAETLGISLALLCHHSKILVDAGVVDKRKEGQTSYYRARPEILTSTFAALLPGGGRRPRTRPAAR